MIFLIQIDFRFRVGTVQRGFPQTFYNGNSTKLALIIISRYYILIGELVTLYTFCAYARMPFMILRVLKDSAKQQAGLQHSTIVHMEPKFISILNGGTSNRSVLVFDTAGY